MIVNQKQIHFSKCCFRCSDLIPFTFHPIQITVSLYYAHYKGSTMQCSVMWCVRGIPGGVCSGVYLCRPNMYCQRDSCIYLFIRQVYGTHQWNTLFFGFDRIKKDIMHASVCVIRTHIRVESVKWTWTWTCFELINQDGKFHSTYNLQVDRHENGLRAWQWKQALHKFSVASKAICIYLDLRTRAL